MFNNCYAVATVVTTILNATATVYNYCFMISALKSRKKGAAALKKSKLLTPRSVDNMKQRVQSARRAKANELRNELEEV